MATNIDSSPPLTPKTSVSGVMLQVIYALVPGVLAYIWFFGWGVVFNILFAVITALVTEIIMLRLRHRAIMPFITDGSAIVTAILLALALPPVTPWWVIFIGIGFAMVFGKHLFGGLGYNPFNPAMLGYAVLLISFPIEMTVWPLPDMLNETPLGFLDSLIFMFSGNLPQGLSLDGITSATVLDTVKTELGRNLMLSEIYTKPIFGTLGGKGWEWINIGFLAGGAWLIYRRIISWHIPLAVLGGLFIIALLFYIFGAGGLPSPIFHVFSGAAILGAFFIATDPVTASTTLRGQLYFGAGIGILTYIIRTWGGYPDGIAFAVLLMNMAAPTIDYYTKPRVFGHSPDNSDRDDADE
ncbi:MAG: electron transport complex subunit RsxD [Gammaproteobacteria bacterium]|nr:MAG: electron transport complex subunit RsxD [Gammaproteobacteria bacterium]